MCLWTVTGISVEKYFKHRRLAPFHTPRTESQWTDGKSHTSERDPWVRSARMQWGTRHLTFQGTAVTYGKNAWWKNRQPTAAQSPRSWTCKNKFWFTFSETNLVRLGSSASRHYPTRRPIKQNRQQRLEVVPQRHRRVFGRQTNLLSDGSVSSQGSAEDAKPKSDVPAG